MENNQLKQIINQIYVIVNPNKKNKKRIKTPKNKPKTKNKFRNNNDIRVMKVTKL